MINLMYVVLMAMLALNVSSDVLNGFSLVYDGLQRATENATQTNQGIYATFDAQMEANPAKTREWYEKAKYVRGISDSLYNLADELKIAIVRKSDGEEGRVDSIKNREDLEASTQVMLAPGRGRGEELLHAIDNYREKIVEMVSDEQKKEIIASNLSTDVPKKDELMGKNWQQAMFESMPVAAATTLLTKLQSDVRYAEGEVLHSLINNIDVKDVRVNSLNAYVIPNAQTIVQGSKFSARIIMAAVDTTQTPAIYIGDQLYNSERSNYYTATATREGIQTLKGYLEVRKPDGSAEQLPFETDYFVSEPVATVSNTMMNVMYAGIDNPLSISVPGIAASQVSASMTNGTLSRSGNGWVAKPKEVNKDAVITVTAQQNGRSMTVSQTTFRVRRLPDPTPYLLCKDAAGNTIRYKGGTPISKAALLGAGGIHAAIDDGLLNVEFSVKSFRIDIFDSMGNDIPEDSQTAEYSERQRTSINRLQRGKKFFITRVKAVGPDGIERTLSPIEVVVN